MNRDDQEFRMKDIDEGVSNEILNQHRTGFQSYLANDYNTCFRSYKFIFMSVKSYEFSDKNDLLELNEVLEGYFDSLQGRAANQHEQLVMGQKSFEVKKLIDVYITLVINSLNEMGKWLKIYRTTQDRDEQFSKETFGTSLSLLDSKREVLNQHTKEEIIKYMTPNMIHFVHGRIIIKEAE